MTNDPLRFYPSTPEPNQVPTPNTEQKVQREVASTVPVAGKDDGNAATNDAANRTQDSIRMGLRAILAASDRLRRNLRNDREVCIPLVSAIYLSDEPIVLARKGIDQIIALLSLDTQAAESLFESIDAIVSAVESADDCRTLKPPRCLLAAVNNDRRQFDPSHIES